MNKVTKMALAWLGDGLTEAKAVENVKDELVYDILEQYELQLEDKEMAKLERIVRVAVDTNINWEEIEEACADSEATEMQRGAQFMARKYTDEEKTLIRVHWALVLLMAILAGFCIGEIITATKEAAQIYYEEMELQDANQG